MKKSPEPIILARRPRPPRRRGRYLAFTFPSVPDITGVSSTTATGKTPPAWKAEDLQKRLDPWNTPAAWPDNPHRLFISEGFLFYPGEFPNGQYIRKVDPNVRTPSGVLISWFQKYSINFTDPNVDREDPDNDGFSNIVEFKNEALKAAEADGTQSTNPLDPQSHPSYLSRLRLQKYESRPFHIQFAASSRSGA